MVLKNVGIAIICTTLLAWSGPSLADEYRPDEFLRLDLSRALLSPKPLGPPSEFAPVAVEARSDAAQIPEEPSVDYRAGVVRTTKVKPARSEPVVEYTPRVRASKVKQAHIAKPHVPARANEYFAAESRGSRAAHSRSPRRTSCLLSRNTAA